jgi:ankyrin repeat protein
LFVVVVVVFFVAESVVAVAVVADKEGWSVVHHIVNPTEFGSYENVEFLKLLASKGARLDLEDKKGHTPMFYAHLQVRFFFFFLINTSCCCC